MDKSEEYQVMSDEALKIIRIRGQLALCPACDKIWLAQPGEKTIGSHILCPTLRSKENPQGVSNLQYLYTQSQLQAIYSEGLKTSVNNFLFFWQKIYDRGELYQDFQFYSWDQLWLAFVMHEKFKKLWNPQTKKWEEK